MRALLIAPISAASLLARGGQRTSHLYRSPLRFGTVDVVLVSQITHGRNRVEIERLLTAAVPPPTLPLVPNPTRGRCRRQPVPLAWA